MEQIRGGCHQYQYTDLVDDPKEWDAAGESVVIPKDTPSKRSQYLHSVQEALRSDTSRLQLIILSLDNSRKAYRAEDLEGRTSLGLVGFPSLITLFDSTFIRERHIEDLPANVHFLQDCGCEIDGVKFFGLAYDHPEELIPDDADIVVTHEPPIMVLDKSNGTHWGNLSLRNRLELIKPRYHLFGHAHESFGTLKDSGTIFSNASLLDERNKLVREPRLFLLE